MKRLVSIAFVICIAASGCAPKTPENVVAKYEYGEITKADLERQMTTFAGTVLERIENYSALGGGEQALKDIIAEKRLAEKALASGVDKTEEFQLEMARKEKDILVAAAEWQTIVEKADPTEEDLKAYFEKNHAQFDLPEQAKVKSIFLPVPPGSTKEDEQTALLLAEEIMGKLQSDEASFEEMVKKYSKAPDAEKGGDEVLVAKGVYPATVEAQIFNTKEGSVSEIVRTRSGYVFFKVEKIIPAREVALEEVRDKIFFDLRKERREQRQREVIEAVKAEENLSTHPEVFLGDQLDTKAVAIKTASKDYTVDDVIKRFSLAMLAGASKAGREEVQKYLDRYVFDIVMMKKAEELGIDKSEKTKTLLETWRVRTLAETYANMQASKVPECTDEEIQETFEEMKQHYKTPKMISFREILVGVPSGLDAVDYERYMFEAQQLAQDIRKRADSGADFGELAKEYSSAETASDGGLVDYVDINRLSPQRAVALNVLKAGEMTGPERVRNGFLLMKVEGVQMPEPMPFEEAKERAAADCLSMKQQKKHQEILDEAYSMDDVEIFRENLQKALSTIKPLT